MSGVRLTEAEEHALVEAVTVWSHTTPGIDALNEWPNVVAAVERILTARATAPGDDAGLRARVDTYLVESRQALHAAAVIGARSCRPGDGLNLANHDRLVDEADRLRAALAAHPEPTDTAATERVSAVLAEHTPRKQSDGESAGCWGCGWTPDAEWFEYSAHTSQHRAHVAAAVVAALRPPPGETP